MGWRKASKIGRATKKMFKPESLMMSYGYCPEWSEGALKPPIFKTSAWVFKTAEEGERFFKALHGEIKVDPSRMGLVYSRINNPNVEMCEDRLALLEGAETGALFCSGMAAVDTTLRTFLRPGDIVLHSEPLYGGTDELLQRSYREFGVRAMSLEQAINENAFDNGDICSKLVMVFIETPANPTLTMVDIESVVHLVRDSQPTDRRILVVVDNTFLGPLWQHPLKHGADLVVYSATKYVGGHSDLVAGACLGSKALIDKVKGARATFGTIADPEPAWLILRSLETLALRMEHQAANATQIAEYLQHHLKVERVYYPDLFWTDHGIQHSIFRKQCLSAGAMISFDLKGGKKASFRFLNHLGLIKLAVSLGSTESLAEHPASMTHSMMSPQDRERLGISDKMIRFSVGIEDCDDLIKDLEQALASA